MPRGAVARAAGVLVPLAEDAAGRAGRAPGALGFLAEEAASLDEDGAAFAVVWCPGRSTGNTGSGGASSCIGSDAGVGAGDPPVAQANRGPLDAMLPRDHPSAGQRAGRASVSRSRRSITRLGRERGRRCCSTTTTEGEAAAPTASRCRRGGARLRRALRKRRMLRFESGFEWTIQATAAMTTSHNPIANKLMTNPRIEPPPFRLWRHPRRPASSDANFRRRGSG